ncbi:MAG: hypothetical protein ACTSSH_14040 [Candidatus Heimdallarchaeota archaeon]
MNNVKTLSEKLGNLRLIEEFHVSKSPIEAIPESFTQLTYIKSIDIVYTKLTTLFSLNQCTKLEVLVIDKRLEDQLPETIKKIKDIKISAHDDKR